MAAADDVACLVRVSRRRSKAPSCPRAQVPFLLTVNANHLRLSQPTSARRSTDSAGFRRCTRLRAASSASSPERSSCSPRLCVPSSEPALARVPSGSVPCPFAADVVLRRASVACLAARLGAQRPIFFKHLLLSFQLSPSGAGEPALRRRTAHVRGDRPGSHQGARFQGDLGHFRRGDW